MGTKKVIISREEIIWKQSKDHNRNITGYITDVQKTEDGGVEITFTDLSTDEKEEKHPDEWNIEEEIAFVERVPGPH